MTFKEINECQPGTPVMLADSKIGILIFDGRVSEDEHHAAVRILGGDRMVNENRSVRLSALVDLRKERGAIVELDFMRSGVMHVHVTRTDEDTKGSLCEQLAKELRRQSPMHRGAFE